MQYQKRNEKKKSLFRSFKRQINSAETLLYENMALYDCVAEEDNDKKLLALESTFSKVWMLHCYLDDVIEDEEDLKGERSL